MSTFSQTTDQKATIKRPKILRNPQEVYRKIISFKEISDENKGKSAREITRLLQVSNSTMQSWLEQDISEQTTEYEVFVFLKTLPGRELLDKIVIASMYNNKCGSSGILGMQEFLRHSGLDKYVASSVGALQSFWNRCEDSILEFGRIWIEKMSKAMQERKITVITDEMFRKGNPCLVAIEAVSNYILLEKFTEDRKAETWKKELEKSIKNMPVIICQLVSDLCGALRSLTRSIDAVHSPDIFHGLYELSKAISAALSSQERAAEKALIETKEELAQLAAQPIRLDKVEKEKQRVKQEKLIKQEEVLKKLHEERKKRKEETQQAKKELGKIYHPIDLDTGNLQSPTVAKKKIEKQIGIITDNAEKAGLSEKSLDRIQKAKRAFALMWDFYRCFFLVFLASIRELNLEGRKFFKEVVFPLAYLNMIWRRLPKKEKQRLVEMMAVLQKKFKEGPGTEEVKKALMRRGKDLAERFQRSSSCVEGRNGVLSLLLHRFHHIDEKTLQVLTIVHNFGVKRKDDGGSTAAERFFGSKHDDLFEHLVKTVRIPGKPQVQVRKARGQALAA